MSLPGRCVGCGCMVHWSGLSWVSPGKSRAHVCNPKRRYCGARMARNEERCARRAGHATEHRTAYAMENASLARFRRGRGRAA